MGEAVRSWGLPKWSNCRHWAWGDEEVGEQGRKSSPLPPIVGFWGKGEGERGKKKPLPFTL